MNMNVQLRDNGHKIFYLSEKPKAGAIMGGEGEPERDSTIISVFENDKETKLVELKATTGQSIVDWLVSPDSTKIYYLTQDSDKGNINLHMLSISDKKDTVIKANLAEPGTINNPLFMTRDRTLLIYSGGENYELTEHKVTAAGYSKRDLRAPCKCILNYPQAISPDGKKLLLIEQTSGEAPSDFIYYVLDTLTNKNTKIAKSTTNEQWASSIWSPNSDSIFYSTASFGDTPSTFKPRLEMIGINNKKPKSVIKDELRSKDQVSALSWSPDGRYLVYSQNDKVRFYDMETGKILSNSINSESFATSDKSFGWY
jgi:Tol biopolymer transport system component